MKVTKQKFGVLSDGTKVSLFTVSNGQMSFSVSDYGATITSIVLGCGNEKTDVVLGYSTLDGYVNDSKFFGATVARFAGRINGASFTLEGKTYNLDKNAGKNSLHGGFNNSNKMMWKLEPVKTKKNVGVKCTRTFYDGEQGMPGNLEVCITYSLDSKNRIKCIYEASTDKPTPINITNHSYFNLAGSGTVLDHTLTLNCNKILELDSDLIPTGKFIDVKNTPYDFTVAKKIGKDIDKVGIGYDNCYVTEMYDEDMESALPDSAKPIACVAELCHEQSGRKMTVHTNLEGIQFYTANYIQDVIGKNGCVHNKHDAACFESQCFPDSPNKPGFPSCILYTGKKYYAETIFSFIF